MIFYKNIKKQNKVNEQDLKFSIFSDGVVSNIDEINAKPNQCRMAYNLNCQDGTLKAGLGFKDFEAPTSLDDLADVVNFDFCDLTEITNIWTSKIFKKKGYTYQIVLTDVDNFVYYIELIEENDGIVWPLCDMLTSDPIYECQYRINNQDCILIFTNNEMMYLSNGKYNKDSTIPPMLSCVVHYDKFFGITNTNRNELIYTQNLNLLQWSEEEKSAMEFMDNRGMFTKLVAFNDYVYLFREYGITRLSIYSTKSDFSVTHQYTSSSKIFEDSVCVCGDKVLFVSRNGLFSFNGSTVKRIAQNFDVYFQNLDNTNCCSACLDGKFYFATKCNFHDGEKVGCENSEYVNNVLFEYDPETDKLNVLRGVDIRKLLAVNTPFMHKICACFHNEYCLHLGELTTDGQIFGTCSQMCWQSYKTDLGFHSKRKRLKEITLKTKGDCELQIVSDEETKILKFSGNENEIRKKISIFGKEFQFMFKSNTLDCKIECPMISFDVMQ